MSADGQLPAGAPPLLEVPPLLQVKGVTLQYKTRDSLVTATYRVDFDVRRSDRFVLLGPSGCGKSTLLKGDRRVSHASGRRRASRLKDKVVRMARAPTA